MIGTIRPVGSHLQTSHYSSFLDLTAPHCSPPPLAHVFTESSAAPIILHSQNTEQEYDDHHYIDNVLVGTGPLDGRRRGCSSGRRTSHRSYCASLGLAPCLGSPHTTKRRTRQSHWNTFGEKGWKEGAFGWLERGRWTRPLASIKHFLTNSHFAF